MSTKSFIITAFVVFFVMMQLLVYDDKIPFENDRFYKKEIKLQDIPDKCPE